MGTLVIGRHNCALAVRIGTLSFRIEAFIHCGYTGSVPANCVRGARVSRTSSSRAAYVSWNRASRAPGQPRDGEHSTGLRAVVHTGSPAVRPGCKSGPSPVGASTPATPPGVPSRKCLDQGCSRRQKFDLPTRACFRLLKQGAAAWTVLGYPKTCPSMNNPSHATFRMTTT